MEKILKRHAAIIAAHKLYSIALAASFVAGVVAGLILACAEEKALFAGNAVDFLIMSLGKDYSVFKLFFVRILTDIGFFLLFFVFGLTVWLYPLHFILIVYRGYVLGAAAIVFFSCFKITGAVLFIFAVFVQNVVTTLGLILFSIHGFHICCSSKECGKFDFRNYAVALGIGFTVSLLGALIELIMLGLVLRPLNFYF